ncbi:hypothetical protein MLD38_030219 [Melastoma candidum]|uniref:Uncharacterized protein n=1 Tax=Melastoma candidum TaxID=119954 RepID=A0ACB9MKM3_9MYRT|nr:hypothetical protein MLD38_030219 [Melastoma candidum]
MVAVTPCFNVSPPRSCKLLDPSLDSSCWKDARDRKATPFPLGLRKYDNSLSESNEEGSSEVLTQKYPELLGIRRDINKGNREEEPSPEWSFSPPKTCAVMEPPPERSPHNASDSFWLIPLCPMRQPSANREDSGMESPRGEPAEETSGRKHIQEGAVDEIRSKRIHGWTRRGFSARQPVAVSKQWNGNMSTSFMQPEKSPRMNLDAIPVPGTVETTSHVFIYNIISGFINSLVTCDFVSKKFW